jgi:hypothetical protein
MPERNQTASVADYGRWASHTLGELRSRFVPELAAGASRLATDLRPTYAALAQACSTLEAAVDAIDLQLMQPPAPWRRIFRRRPDPAISVFRRQLAQVAKQWPEVRKAAAAVEQAIGAAEGVEKRAFLEIGLTIKDFQPQLAHVEEWLALGSQDRASADERIERMRFDFSHVQLAEARAHLLLEELQRLALSRSSLMDMLNIELVRSLNVWEIRTEELLDQRDRGSALKQLLAELAPKHIALRRMVHKAGATCQQLQQQEAEVLELAREVVRPSHGQQMRAGRRPGPSGQAD